ncbi:MAG: amidohydrolase, partial [Synergistaceae bacterium]|nr:amidohydrolase [Synergistaceae bacterium]
MAPLAEKYLVGGTVLTGRGERIENGAVVFGGGKVARVGTGIPIPGDAEVYDCAGKVVTPGLIDAHVHMGAYNEGFPENMQDANDMVEPVVPQLRILDALYPGDTAFSDALAGGVTCVQTLPGSGNVIGGQGAIVKTKAGLVEDMVVRAPSAMKAALGENPARVYSAKGKLPNTRMGTAFLMRDAFVHARNYREKMESSKKKGEPFERSLAMEALLPV